MRARYIIATATAAAALSGAALASPPVATQADNPLAGRYPGTTSIGASMSFTVTRGRRVASLRARVRYSCDGDAPVTERFAPSASFRVRRGRFSGRVQYVTIRGRFVTPTRATGTIRVYRRFSEFTICRGEQRWPARRR